MRSILSVLVLAGVLTIFSACGKTEVETDSISRVEDGTALDDIFMDESDISTDNEKKNETDSSSQIEDDVVAENSPGKNNIYSNERTKVRPSSNQSNTGSGQTEIGGSSQTKEEPTKDNIPIEEEPTKDNIPAEEGYITIYDGDNEYEIKVSAYGNEVQLPEAKGSSEGGKFIGWISDRGELRAAGDKVVTEEFLSYTAAYTSPDYGLLIILDNMGKGYSTRFFENEVEVEDPYVNDYNFNNVDYYIDHYADKAGKTYNFGDTVNMGNNEYLILTSVYSKDLTAAYKVSISLNTPEDIGLSYEDSYKYVKKGSSIPIDSMIEYNNYTLIGWYDAPEGGNLSCKNGEIYTPSADIKLFAQWRKN